MSTDQHDNVPPPHRCPFCGERLWVQDRFCGNCGSPVKYDDAPAGETATIPDASAPPEPAREALDPPLPKRPKRFWNRGA